MEQDLTKKILIESILCLNYGWKQHPKCTMDKQCVICLDNVKDKYALETNCGHYFDYDCIMFSMHDFKFYKCPDCQTPYKKLNLSPFT